MEQQLCEKHNPTTTPCPMYAPHCLFCLVEEIGVLKQGLAHLQNRLTDTYQEAWAEGTLEC